MSRVNTPLVTIIVCCYNAAATISSTLNSLLNQTYSNYGILVIDDGSSDCSVSVVQEIANLNSKVKLVCNVKNHGIACSRMRGLNTTDSDLVMFFDSDDLAEPNLLQRLIEKMQQDENILGVSCYARYFNDFADLGIQKIGPVTKDAFLENFRSNRMTFLLPVTLFKREVALSVGGYRLNIMPNEKGVRYEDFSEDVDLWCRMSDLGRDGRYFITIPEPLFRYRKPANSLSTRNVHLMQLKMRWIKDCLLRRRSGEGERTLAEFIASRGLLVRINDYREDSAAKLYKLAGFAYSNGSYFKLLIFVFFSALLSPKLIWQKVKTQTVRAAN